MTNDAQGKRTRALRPGQTEIERIEDHRVQVRVWFAGLNDEDQRELVDFLREYPLVTYHALVAAAQAWRPR